jgi:hypothetical protein
MLLFQRPGELGWDGMRNFSIPWIGAPTISIPFVVRRVNKWILGVLSNVQMKDLCKPGWNEGNISPSQIGYSAFDLTLTGEE